MQIDVAINPFDADVAAMVSFAAAAEAAGVDGVWVADHFSGSVVGRAWSRDPFVCLGAIAATTRNPRVGTLVANMRNRHALQLASAMSSLQSLAPGRVVCGVGSGAVPGSRFAVEHEMIGTDLGTGSERRAGLIDSIEALRAVWSGVASHSAASIAPTSFEAASGVVEPSEPPPIVVGASAWATIESVLGVADGVNLRRTPELPDVLDRIARSRPEPFEVSVLTGLDDAFDRAMLDTWRGAGVDRIVLGVSPPHDHARLARIDELRRLLE